METPNRNISIGRAERRRAGFGRGRVWAGLIVVAVGTLLLARQVGVDVPDWIISWPSFFIALGLFIGAKHGFKDWGWVILVLIGAALHTVRFMGDDFNYKNMIWPVVIIAVGLIIMLRPRSRERFWSGGESGSPSQTPSSGINPSAPTEVQARTGADNTFENVNIFGGSKKVIISKDFYAGEVVTVFGGSEINFMQADVNGRAEIEIVQIFGGAKLIVPPNWKLQTEELVCIFGGLDDKRNPATLTPDPQKVLVLKGTCIFGGIDIRSF